MCRMIVHVRLASGPTYCNIGSIVDRTQNPLSCPRRDSCTSLKQTTTKGMVIWLRKRFRRILLIENAALYEYGCDINQTRVRWFDLRRYSNPSIHSPDISSRYTYSEASHKYCTHHHQLRSLLTFPGASQVRHLRSRRLSFCCMDRLLCDDKNIHEKKRNNRVLFFLNRLCSPTWCWHL